VDKIWPKGYEAAKENDCSQSNLQSKAHSEATQRTTQQSKRHFLSQTKDIPKEVQKTIGAFGEFIPGISVTPCFKS